MKNNTIMTTYTNGHDYTDTDATYIYKWLAHAYICKALGSKAIKRIAYHQKYDGNYHMTFYISNGTRVEITIPMS